MGYWRLVATRFWSHWVHRLALVGVCAVVFVAVAADFLASDKPLVVSLGGQVYWFPNLADPPSLREFDNARLVEAMGDDDWAVLPIVPWGYNNHDDTSILSAPSKHHWFGTDASGRDVAARVIHGARVSLVVGLSSSVLLIAIGVALGALAGYVGGWVDEAVMRVVEALNTLPTLLMMVAALAVLSPHGWGAVWTMTMVIGVLHWTGVARLIRAEILRIRELDYITASRAAGASHLRVVTSHIVPNAMSPVLVAATFALASGILVEGTLSFLGFGIPPDMASWGGLIRQVAENWQAHWLAVFPGTAIFLTVVCFNLAGEGLRDAADPRWIR